MTAETDSARATLNADPITVPRPHVPHGPVGGPTAQADAGYLHEAARKMENRPPFGSNLTATVVKLLRDSAEAIGASGDER